MSRRSAFRPGAARFERPAFERRFAFPEQFAVAMDVLAVAIVFGRVIAKQPQVEEIGRARQKFEWREIAFVQRTGVGPNPADAIFFQKTNDLRPMPAGMAEFDRETKIARQLLEEFAKAGLALLRREGRRQLNEDDVKLRRERLERAEKGDAAPRGNRAGGARA